MCKNSGLFYQRTIFNTYYHSTPLLLWKLRNTNNIFSKKQFVRKIVVCRFFPDIWFFFFLYLVFLFLRSKFNCDSSQLGIATAVVLLIYWLTWTLTSMMRKVEPYVKSSLHSMDLGLLISLPIVLFLPKRDVDGIRAKNSWLIDITLSKWRKWS